LGANPRQHESRGLGEGINLAYEQAASAFVEGGINQVVLCTDGDFNIGPSSNEELIEIIEDRRRGGVTLTALGFGRGNLNDAMMELVSNAGNGIYSVIYNEDRAGEFLDRPDGLGIIGDEDTGVWAETRLFRRGRQASTSRSRRTSPAASTAAPAWGTIP
jgi:secreted protein with Ig-like and vWFA domain